MFIPGTYPAPKTSKPTRAAKSASGLTTMQRSALTSIASGQGVARFTKATLDTLIRRGLIRWDGSYQLTDAGRAMASGTERAK